MEKIDWDVWHWLAMLQHELLLFAGVFFLIGALDDLAVDIAWLWLKVTGRAKTHRVNRAFIQHSALHGPAAVFIPAWQEHEVIGDTITHMLGVWGHDQMRLYVGVYRNDPATLEAAMLGAAGDPRVRMVMLDRNGPSTKADCLNRLHIAMREDELRSGGRFNAIIFHDAEDMVDPAGLTLLDDAIASGADFAQLPVEPLPQIGWRWMGSHYCEEFAEAHGKAMVVRGAIGAALPAAGVGCAVSRRALDMLCERRGSDVPFEPMSLTEDYELGLSIGEAGGTCRFVRARGEDGLLVATRAFFPSDLRQIVRQKTRWVHGIALQGWDRIGWHGGMVEHWMRARDRRGPLTALVMLLGYALLVVTLAIEAGVAAGLAQPLVLGPLVRIMLIVNLCAFVWRAMWRFLFTARIYGVVEGVLAVLRIPLTNVIAIMSARYAVSAYISSLRGGAVRWDKTEHKHHPAGLGGIGSHGLMRTVRGASAPSPNEPLKTEPARRGSAV